MSFFDDILPVLPALAGGIAGSFAGNPMLGASIGGGLGNMFLGKMGNPYDNLSYVGPPPGQGFTPTDMAAMEKARRMSERFSQGREGAIEQRAATSMGPAGNATPAGYARSQQTAQEGAERFSEFGLGQAGIATQRDAENRRLLNEFNLKHTMLKGDFAERQNYADKGNWDNLFSNIGAYGMYNMNKQRPSGQAGPEQYASRPGYRDTDEMGV